MKQYLSYIFAFFLILFSSTAAYSQASDEQALVQYRLSLEKIQKLAGVYRNLVEIAENDPALYAKMRKADTKDPELDAGKLQVDAVVKKFEKGGPKVLGAITSAGFTPREFVLANLSFLQAAMANAFLKNNLDRLPRTVPRENVEFLQKNEKELNAVVAEIRSLTRKLEAKAEEDAEDEQ